ncbi:Zn(II)2Cys6 transcription factor [Sporobolomyces salmoneus]|uniref:Zn(II)2Cys6 transcription factor n=1 Tax=Sporobolomyces salmoneus TaxID=183962 RepID=UPI0031759F31
MQGPGHPLQGVGYRDRPTPFDQLSRVAMAHNQQSFPPPSAPIASTSSQPSKRAPTTSSNGASPPADSVIGRPAKKARKSSAGGAAIEGDQGAALEPHQKKRSKQVLSCSECKRRKIKCDRCQPCSACVKRGAPNDCCWEDAKIEPERQPFALVEDVDEMRERLALLERFINKLPPGLTTTSFAELGIERMGPMRREMVEDIGRNGHQMFEDMDKLDNGECPEMYSLPGECFPSVEGKQNQNSHDNLELLENALMIVTQDPERRRVELTTALTSILALPPRFVDSTSATRLGLDLVFTEAEFREERSRTLDKIFRILPNKEESYKSIERYWNGFHWMFTCLHMPSFEAEHDKYWEMTEAGRREEVDPAWLAIYTLVLALSWNDAAHLSPWMLSDVKELTAEEEAKREREASAFCAASQKLLLLADAQGRPQVRTMQYVMLMACWTVIAAVDWTDWGRFSTQLSLAIRVGHTLQLHRLTDDPESMPPDDPAWPPGKNSVKRENALRIWSAFTFYDHLAAISRYSTYMIHPDHTTTPILSNIESTLLSPTEWQIDPQPDSIATDATLERHKYRLAEISRKTFDMYVAGKKRFNYGAILELDKEYRTILDSMPDTWIHEHKSLEDMDPFLKSRRYGALQSVHNRIVRLHRPFLTKGYAAGSKFAYSTEACIKSAKIVLFCHHKNVGFVIKPLYSHSLSASIVLAADLFHHIDIGTNSAEIEEKKENLALALEIFSEKGSNRVRSGHLKMIISQARRILSGLFLEVEKRRVRRMARLGGQGSSTQNQSQEMGKEEESFAEILARIAKEDPSAPLALNQPQPSTSNTVQAPSSTSSNSLPGPSRSTPTSFPASYASMSAPASSSLPPSHQTQWNPSSFPSTSSSGGFTSSLPTTTQPPPPTTNVNGNGGVDELFSNNFLSDLGLLSNSQGQLIDYYASSQPNPPAAPGGNGAMYSSSNGGGSGGSGGPSPSDSFDLAFFGLGTEEGNQFGAMGGGPAGSGQDATQVLFNQLTAGW